MSILPLLLVLIMLLLLAAGYAAFYFAAVRQKTESAPKGCEWILPYLDAIREGAKWFRDQDPEKVTLVSGDSLRLTGYLLPAPEAKGTVLMVHGYRSSPWTDFGLVYRFYHRMGWNILTVWQRAHSESEGRFITFGIRERLDVRDWAYWLADRFGPDHAIVLSGISMGSTSVLMALGSDLPKNVRCVIADCGFISPYDEFRHLMKTRFRLPPWPLMGIADYFAHLAADFGFRRYSTLEALKHNRIPVLFFHGERDTFVPVHFTVKNYAACAAEKRLVTVPNAGHGASYLMGKETCEAALTAFLEKYAQ